MVYGVEVEYNKDRTGIQSFERDDMEFTATGFDLRELPALRQKWAKEADALRREPEHRDAFPRSMVRTVPDETAYQGIRVETVGDAAELKEMAF